MSDTKLVLFPEAGQWLPPSAAWKPFEDRIRGGSSKSNLVQVPGTTNVRFSGTLDTKTLGGAGFASYTTTSKTWDLSKYDGFEIEVVKGDGKTYTLVVKDEVPAPGAKREDGRDPATINWQWDFKAEAGGKKVFVAWKDFTATYRGRDKSDAGPLKTKEIKRIGIMMRSFFGNQEGNFELILASISAVKK